MTTFLRAGQPGISLACMALAMIGTGKPYGYEGGCKGYEARALPHFQQRPKANRKKRGKR